MTIPEAIKLLEYINCTDDTHLYLNGHKALQLGIEALKRLQLKEPYASFHLGDPLPCETKD